MGEWGVRGGASRNIVTPAALRGTVHSRWQGWGKEPVQGGLRWLWGWHQRCSLRAVSQDHYKEQWVALSAQLSRLSTWGLPVGSLMSQ